MTITATPEKVRATARPAAKKPAPAPVAPVRVVVTRNYLEKTGARYVVRPLDAEAAKEAETLVLTAATVEFTGNDRRFHVEADFGCGIVMVGMQAPGEVVPKNAEKLRFDGSGFRTVDGEESVDRAEKMFFTPLGIFAVNPR